MIARHEKGQRSRCAGGNGEGASEHCAARHAITLIAHAQITKQDFVIITAASSSVGIAAIEMVKAEGAISVATTRTSKKKATLAEVGATHVIATQEEDFSRTGKGNHG